MDSIMQGQFNFHKSRDNKKITCLKKTYVESFKIT